MAFIVKGLRGRRLCLPFTGVPRWVELKGLRQFGGESAARGLFLFFGSLGTPAGLYRFAIRRRGGGGRCSIRRELALSRLCRVGAKQLAFERRTVKTTDNVLHLIRRGGLHEREAFGLLRFVVADDFDGIRHQIFRRQPSFDVVSGDP